LRSAGGRAGEKGEALLNKSISLTSYQRHCCQNQAIQYHISGSKILVLSNSSNRFILFDPAVNSAMLEPQTDDYIYIAFDPANNSH
jgi:hypothetical protein